MSVGAGRAEALGRRARAQWPVLAALLAVVLGGATLLGTCALLVTHTAERAVEVAAGRAGPDEVDVTAYIGTVQGADARSVATDTRDLVTAALAPFAATTTARASTLMRALARPDQPGGSSALGYLSGVDDLPARAALTAGRWPRGRGRGPAEAVVLESTARQLGLVPGGRIRLSAEPGAQPRVRRRRVDRRRHRAPAARHRLAARHSRRRRLRPGVSERRRSASRHRPTGHF